ncbi:MAG: hypothetical protein HDR50_06615 [Desulfovibrio sp.]|uniref:hypothetical protein n=1 Tax=Desulfovibrio sp. TaxID=885 RepID=UPI001A6E75DF|nr:hypothetical protein [Desulfovibrio sp.]MBD5417321.1 hypothetical protein [Desulfovibrio sp.]
MPNDIDLSNEALLKHRAIAEKATPSFIQEGLSIYGPLHPESKHPNGRIFVAKVAEGSNRRDPHLFDGAGVGSGPADAAHIAANSPDVVKAHVDEILRLRAEVQRLGTIVTGYQVSAEEAQEIMGELQAENERLNKEVDWLAAAALSLGGCPSVMKRPDCTGNCPNCWRETARNVTENPA